jgi:hypothetical protein
MCPAAILGDRASGKTTFLGLLYAAQVKYGTQQGDSFRFHAPPPSLKFMGAIYEGMSGGQFPSATLKDEVTEVGFLFGYRRTVMGKLPSWIPQTRFTNPFSVLHFMAYDVSGEDVQEFIESGVAASPIIQQLLKSVVVVILVDCSKMTLAHDSPQYKQMLRYDTEVAKLAVNFQTYKVQEYQRLKAQGLGEGLPLIYPTIVLTKFDQLSDEVLAKLGLHRGIPPTNKEKERREYAEAILRVFLPQTLSQLRGGKVAGVSFDQAAYFVSWIHTETADGGMAPVGKAQIVVKDATANSAAEPDFAYDEYVGFIEHFRDIAHKVPDAVSERDQLRAV